MYLIIDCETTGLPTTINYKYPPYFEMEYFNYARIVQLTMLICDYNFNQLSLQDYIIKSNGYNITNSQFHGITNEISQKEGIYFEDVAKILSNNLSNVTHIIAHNANFDISIVKSELHRLGLYNIIEQIDTKIIYCSMLATKYIINSLNSKNNIKNPSLAELYKFATNKEIEHAHNSKYDTINLCEALRMLHKKKYNLYLNFA